MNPTKPVYRVDLSDSYGPQMHADAMFAYCRNVRGCNISQSDFNPRYILGKGEFLMTFPAVPDVISIPLFDVFMRTSDDCTSAISLLEWQLRRLAVIAMTYQADEAIAEEYRAIWPVVSSDLSDSKAPFSELVYPVFQGLNNVDFRIGTAELKLMTAKEIKKSGETIDIDTKVDVNDFAGQAEVALSASLYEGDELEVNLFRRRAIDHLTAIVEATAGDNLRGSAIRAGEEVDRGLFYDRRIYTYVRHDYKDEPDQPLYTRIEYRYRRLKVNTTHLRAIYNSFR